MKSQGKLSTSTEIATTNVAGALESAGVFTTVSGDDFSAKAKVFNAINSAKSLRDEIMASKGGEVPLKIADIVVQSVEITNETTGETENAARVILIDDKGVAHSGTSKGLLSSVKNIIQFLGEPATWPKDANVTFIAGEGVSRNGRRFMTLRLA